MASTTPFAALGQARSIVERERLSVSAHRDAVRGASFPPPKKAPPGTFLHGFLLPFSLIVATLRHRTLGASFLRLTVVRALCVALLSLVAFSGSDRAGTKHQPGPVVKVIRTGKDSAQPAAAESSKGVHVHAPGVHVDLDRAQGQNKVVVLGREVPVIDDDNEPPTAKQDDGDSAEKTDSRWAFVKVLSSSWTWILWFIGVVSATEGVVIFFSRRWDDWLGFYASPLASVRPEDDEPKTPKLAIDIKWLIKKLKRRVRGYLVFAAGIPLIAVFQLLPTIGSALFSVGLMIWGWYWLGVFTAAKSAHAWVDDPDAPSPYLIRELRDRSVGRWWLSPVRLYARLWAWITKDMNSCALAFERNPAPFLGLSLARAILSLPGLYLLARPIIPIAAGRLCAESDPTDRFSAPPLL